MRRSIVPFTASGRARCLDETEGLVKVLTDARTDRILGVHILGPRASDLIAEAVVALEYAASAEDIARVKQRQQASFEADRERWRAAGIAEPAETQEAQVPPDEQVLEGELPALEVGDRIAHEGSLCSHPYAMWTG